MGDKVRLSCSSTGTTKLKISSLVKVQLWTSGSTALIRRYKIQRLISSSSWYSCVHCTLHTANIQAWLLHCTLWLQAACPHNWRTQICARTHDNDTPHVLSHLKLKVCKLHYIPEEVPCPRVYHSS